MRRSVFGLIGTLGLITLPLFASAESGQDYSVLIISRERLEVATPCEIGLYMHDQLVGRLFQEQTASFNLPPGTINVRLRILPGQVVGCAPGMEGSNTTALTLRAGEIKKYRIATNQNGMYLKASPLEY